MPGTLSIGTLTDGTNSTSATNAILGSAKAWVTFDGATGTRLASHNVSSVTRNATADYTVNFATAMTDANYSTSMSGYINNGSPGVVMRENAVNTLRTTTQIRLMASRWSGSAWVSDIDASPFTFQAFR